MRSGLGDSHVLQLNSRSHASLIGFVEQRATNDYRRAATACHINRHALNQQVRNVTATARTGHDIRFGIQISSHKKVPQPYAAPEALVATNQCEGRANAWSIEPLVHNPLDFCIETSPTESAREDSVSLVGVARRQISA